MRLKLQSQTDRFCNGQTNIYHQRSAIYRVQTTLKGSRPSCCFKFIYAVTLGIDFGDPL